MLIKQKRLLQEESPLAYKNIDAVIGSIEKSNAARKVASLRPGSYRKA